MPSSNAEKKTRRKPAGLDVSREITRARERSGLSRSQLSAATGISRTVLIGYEAGRTAPGAREIRLLCDALNVTPNRLLYGKEDVLKTTDDRLSAFGITDDQSAVFPMLALFLMLAHDERSAVLTLMSAVLEGRQGREKFAQSQKALKVMAEWFPSLVGQLGNETSALFEGKVPGNLQADLLSRFAAAGLPTEDLEAPKPGTAIPPTAPPTTLKKRK